MRKLQILELRAKARALREEAERLDSEADELSGGADNRPLTLAELEGYGLNAAALDDAKRTGLDVYQGPRQTLVAFKHDVLNWLERNRA